MENIKKQIVSVFSFVLILVFISTTAFADHQSYDRDVQLKEFPLTLVLVAQAPVMATVYGLDNPPTVGSNPSLETLLGVAASVEFVENPDVAQKRISKLADAYKAVHNVTMNREGDREAIRQDLTSRLSNTVPADLTGKEEFLNASQPFAAMWVRGTSDLTGAMAIYQDHGFKTGTDIIVNEHIMNDNTFANSGN